MRFDQLSWISPLAKTFAEGCKNLEATIVTKLDDNYTKKEVRRHRMQSYFDVHSSINRKVENAKHQYKMKVEDLERVARNIHKRSNAHEMTMMNYDTINAEPQC